MTPLSGLLGNGDKTVTHYLAIFDNIVHRQRFSKFLSIIRADIPEVLACFWFYFMQYYMVKIEIDPKSCHSLQNADM